MSRTKGGNGNAPGQLTVEIQGSSPLALQIDEANKASSRRAVREGLAGLSCAGLGCELDGEDEVPGVWRTFGNAATLSDDEQQVRSLRDLLIPAPGPEGEHTRDGAPNVTVLREVIEQLRRSPTMGEQTLGLIEDVLKNEKAKV